MQDVTREVAAITGRRMPKVFLPIWVGWALLPFSIAAARLTRKQPLFTAGVLRASVSNRVVIHEKASRELGFSPRSARASLEDSFAWYRERGWLEAPRPRRPAREASVEQSRRLRVPAAEPAVRRILVHARMPDGDDVEARNFERGRADAQPVPARHHQVGLAASRSPRRRTLDAQPSASISDSPLAASHELRSPARWPADATIARTWNASPIAPCASAASSPISRARRLAEVGAHRTARRRMPAGARSAQLLWCSIDNDDSRDLDQLSVAERPPDGATRMLGRDRGRRRAGARRAPRSTRTRSAEHHLGLHRGEDLPDAPGALSTDLTSLIRTRTASRSWSSWWSPTDGRCERLRGLPRDGAQPREARLRRRRGVARGRRRRRRRALARRSRLEENLRCRIARAAAARACATSAARSTSRPSRRSAVFDGDELARPRAAAEEPRARADRGLHDRGQRRDRALPRRARLAVAAPRGALARALGRASSTSRAELGEHLPAEPDAAALEAFLAGGARADPLRFPDLSLTIVKLMGSGEYAVELPGRSRAGHFGLAVRDYTHSTAPNRRYPGPDHAAPAEGRARRRAARPTARRARRAGARTAPTQEDDATKVERQVRKSAAALLLEGRDRRALRRHRHGRVRRRAPGCACSQPPVEGKARATAGEGLDVGDRVRGEAGRHRRRARLHRLRARGALKRGCRAPRNLGPPDRERAKPGHVDALAERHAATGFRATQNCASGARAASVSAR